MTRQANSHKGENGKVLIIGGSRHQHGAPLFSALAAEASGVDLLYIALPACHEEVAKRASLNVQVHAFTGNDLSSDDIDTLVELAASMDCAIVGPGIARTPQCLQALETLIGELSCPLVLDATALGPNTLALVQGKQAVLTPHLGEWERMQTGTDDIGAIAKEYAVTIHLKGPTDRIASPNGSIREVFGGNAGLTVGGTGDALAGLIGGLRAQGVEAVEACVLASTAIKTTADELAIQYGFAYGTHRVLELLPQFLHRLSV